MLPFPVGVHLLFTAESATTLIPDQQEPHMRSAIERAAALCSCRVRECAIRPDHVHVLLEVRDEDEAAPVIHAIHDETSSLLQGAHPEFTWSDQVHVTLMPPWHVELFASFLRDQDRYHEKHTVQEELDQILCPDRSLSQQKKAERSRGTVGLHSSGVS